MLNFVKILSALFLAIPAFYFIACSSGEYEYNEYKEDYVEKTIKTDTIRRVEIKETTTIKEDSYIYIVQVGAFSIQSNFDNFFQRAKEVIGSDVYYEQSGNLYKIRVGKFSTRAEAIKFAEFVKTKGYSDAFVVTKKK